MEQVSISQADVDTVDVDEALEEAEQAAHRARLIAEVRAAEQLDRLALVPHDSYPNTRYTITWQHRVIGEVACTRPDPGVLGGWAIVGQDDGPMFPTARAAAAALADIHKATLPPV